MTGASILIVEDETIVAKDIQGTLQDLGYSVPVIVASGEEAIREAQRTMPDLILMDIVLKGKTDGIFAAALIMECYDIPVVYLTAFADDTMVERARLTAPLGYIVKPFSQQQLASSIKVALTQRAARQEMKTQIDKLGRQIDEAIDSFYLFMVKKNERVAQHSRRVASLAAAISAEMGQPKAMADQLYLAGLLHDLGKLLLPMDIIQRPFNLTENENILFKQHPQLGAQIVGNMSRFTGTASLVLQHHERLDGSGYPYGVSGDNIPVAARILAVADTVEMICCESWTAPLGIDKAVDEITQNRGILYDPDVVDAWLKLIKEKDFKFE